MSEAIKDLLILGGVFDAKGGRSSGYINKLADGFNDVLYINRNSIDCINGGRLEDIDRIINQLQGGKKYKSILWMCDIDNGINKYLPIIGEICSRDGIVLVQSKRNRFLYDVGDAMQYSKDDLLDRMDASGAELLVEFSVRHKLIHAKVLRRGGDYVKFPDWSINDPFNIGNNDFIVDESYSTNWLVDVLADELVRIGWLVYPLVDRVAVVDHGKFGVNRKYDVHSGTDLYVSGSRSVGAIESGIVVGVYPFTGSKVESPWWNDTMCIMVKGASGVLCYGEVEPLVAVGDEVYPTKEIGMVVDVLKKDKGLPVAMLHLERYRSNWMGEPIRCWKLGEPKPKGLIDSTSLIKLCGN